MDETNLFISRIEIKEARGLFARILLFVPVLLLVSAVNIKVDPAGSYAKKVDKSQTDEYRIAQALAAGRGLKVSHPVDHRLLEKYFIEDLAAAPDIAVLGGSHSLWLGENIFPDSKVINNAVPDAVLADYLGIFEGYAKKGLYPKRVVLALDPQLIVFPFFSGKWVSIKEDTYGMLERLGVHSAKIRAPFVPQSWLNVFSFIYFQRSMKKLLGRDEQQTGPVNEDTGERQFLFFKDGRCLPGIFSMDNGTSKPFRKFNYKVTNYRSKPDKELEDILERFIRYLTGHHIRVTLCLLPIHPQEYQSFLELRKRPGAFDIVGMERYYRGLAQRSNLEIVGSYDPAVCGLQPGDFYDGEHIKNDVLEKMLKQRGSVCSMPGL